MDWIQDLVPVEMAGFNVVTTWFGFAKEGGCERGMAAWISVADQRAVRAVATLCWRMAGACWLWPVPKCWWRLRPPPRSTCPGLDCKHYQTAALVVRSSGYVTISSIIARRCFSRRRSWTGTCWMYLIFSRRTLFFLAGPFGWQISHKTTLYGFGRLHHPYIETAPVSSSSSTTDPTQKVSWFRFSFIVILIKQHPHHPHQNP